MRHYLAVTDYTPQELQHLLDLALRLKRERQRGGNRPILKGQVLGMVFQKPSLRTRVSFDMAMRHLGGDALYLSPSFSKPARTAKKTRRWSSRTPARPQRPP